MADVIPGVPGLDVFLPLLLDLVADGVLELRRLAAVIGAYPAQIFGLPTKGAIEVGRDADLVLVDLAAARTVEASAFPCSAGWSPYEGRRLRGTVVETWSRGVTVARDGQPVGDPGHGRFLPRNGGSLMHDDGAGTLPREIHVPARTGVAFRVDAGTEIEIIDVEGEQPADFWAYYENDLNEYLSAPHTRIGNMKLLPGVGDAYLTNHRRPIVRVVDDPVPVHDFLSAACDPWRYEELGLQGLARVLPGEPRAGDVPRRLRRVVCPQPFNIWTNFHLHPDGTFEIRRPATKAGDHIVLRAEMPSVIAVSACPQDITLTAGLHPTDLLIRLR